MHTVTMSRRAPILLLALLAACTPPSEDDSTSGATTSAGSEGSTEPTGGGPVCDEQPLSWNLEMASVTVDAPGWTGDPGMYTRKVSATCTVEGDPIGDPNLGLTCDDAGVMRAVTVEPNPHLQLQAGDAVQLDFIADDSGLYPASWLAIRGPLGAVDLHFLAIHAGSLEPPAAGFFAPLVFAEGGDCPAFFDGEVCYTTTKKRVSVQADMGPAITLASTEFGTVAASFGGYLVKIIHAFRLDAAGPCGIQDPTGSYFDLTAVFQFPPD